MLRGTTNTQAQCWINYFFVSLEAVLPFNFIFEIRLCPFVCHLCYGLRLFWSIIHFIAALWKCHWLTQGVGWNGNCPERDVIRGEGNMFTVTLLNAPLVFYTRLCPVPLRWALRRHLYLGDLALHLCPLDLPGSLLIGVGLLHFASPRLLLLQLLPKLLQQRPQGLQHLSVLPKLHGREFRQKNKQTERNG